MSELLLQRGEQSTKDRRNGRVGTHEAVVSARAYLTWSHFTRGALATAAPAGDTNMQPDRKAPSGLHSAKCYHPRDRLLATQQGTSQRTHFLIYKSAHRSPC